MLLQKEGRGEKRALQPFLVPFGYQMDTLGLTQDGPSFSGTFLRNRALQTWEYLWDAPFYSPPFPQVKRICFYTPNSSSDFVPSSSPLRVTWPRFSLSPEHPTAQGTHGDPSRGSLGEKRLSCVWKRRPGDFPWPGPALVSLCQSRLAGMNTLDTTSWGGTAVGTD